MPGAGWTAHLLFDLLAAATGLAATWIAYRWRLRDRGDLVGRAGPGYALAVLAGALLGGYSTGTLNLALSGLDGLGRSSVGALAGAIAAVELFKRRRGIRGSTGVVFVPGFAAATIVGRIGCLLSGTGDFTYGRPAGVPWAVDLGDGVPRHPVQLYESLAMALFLAWVVLALRRRSPALLAHGFYLLVLWYAGQRFAWEFLKPYATLVGPFNLFHVVCAVLVGYSVYMIQSSPAPRGAGA